MVPHITEETQPTSLTTIDFIIAAVDTGMAARIMSGRQATGHFGPVSVPPAAGTGYLTLVSSCGSMGITSRISAKDIGRDYLADIRALGLKSLARLISSIPLFGCSAANKRMQRTNSAPLWARDTRRNPMGGHWRSDQYRVCLCGSYRARTSAR